jgi:DNA polymerase-4
MSGWTTSIIHADLDAFYASVEQLKDPGLAGKPVIVGGASGRGVVTSASYEARRFGVASAMPTWRARRLCPQGIFIAPDFESYGKYSRLVREVFDSFSPTVEQISMDEAFIDVSHARRMWPDAATLAEALRYAVKARTGLVVSAGVASNKFLAKLASTRAKPDGIVVVPPDEAAGFLSPLPLESLWGVGEATSAVLRRLGLATIGDLAVVPPENLEKTMGPLGLHLGELARGLDDRPVVPDAARKSVGAEETFAYDLAEESQMAQALLRLSDRVASRLRSVGISGETVTCKVRFPDFSTVTRSKTLPCEIDGATGIYQVALQLLSKALDSSRTKVRLLGVSVSSIKPWPASEQLVFDRRGGWAEAGQALDRVRRRFGDDALGFASLLEEL